MHAAGPIPHPVETAPSLRAASFGFLLSTTAVTVLMVLLGA